MTRAGSEPRVVFRRRPAPQQAVREFEVLLAERGLTSTSLAQEQALGAWLALGRVAVRVPRGPEVDGLPYQYGVDDFTGRPRFPPHLTRQFAVRGGDEYLQFHCDVQREATTDLASLGRHSEWRFPGDGDLTRGGPPSAVERKGTCCPVSSLSR